MMLWGCRHQRAPERLFGFSLFPFFHFLLNVLGVTLVNKVYNYVIHQIDFCFHAIMVGEGTWHDFNLFSSLRLVLCPNMCSVLGHVPRALEKDVRSAASGWNALSVSIKSTWARVSFKAAVSLSIFCLEDQPPQSVGCYSPCCGRVIVGLFRLVHRDLLSICRGSCVGCIFVSYVAFLLNSVLSDRGIATYFLIYMCMKYLFLSLYF